MGGEDLPGHGEGGAAGHDADRPHGEDGAQAGGIQGQGQPLRRPAFEHPGQQRGEAGGDIELLTSGPRLGRGGLGELLEPPAEGVESDGHEGEQGGDDTVEAAPLGEDHAEAVQGQDGGLGPTEVGEGVADLLGPGIEWSAAWHGRTSGEHGGADDFVSQR